MFSPTETLFVLLLVGCTYALCMSPAWVTAWITARMKRNKGGNIVTSREKMPLWPDPKPDADADRVAWIADTSHPGESLPEYRQRRQRRQTEKTAIYRAFYGVSPRTWYEDRTLDHWADLYRYTRMTQKQRETMAAFKTKLIQPMVWDIGTGKAAWAYSHYARKQSEDRCHRKNTKKSDVIWFDMESYHKQAKSAMRMYDRTKGGPVDKGYAFKLNDHTPTEKAVALNWFDMHSSPWAVSPYGKHVEMNKKDLVKDNYKSIEERIIAQTIDDAVRKGIRKHSEELRKEALALGIKKGGKANRTQCEGHSDRKIGKNLLYQWAYGGVNLTKNEVIQAMHRIYRHDRDEYGNDRKNSTWWNKELDRIFGESCAMHDEYLKEQADHTADAAKYFAGFKLHDFGKRGTSQFKPKDIWEAWGISDKTLAKIRAENPECFEPVQLKNFKFKCETKLTTDNPDNDWDAEPDMEYFTVEGDLITYFKDEKLYADFVQGVGTDLTKPDVVIPDNLQSKCVYPMCGVCQIPMDDPAESCDDCQRVDRKEFEVADLHETTDACSMCPYRMAPMSEECTGCEYRTDKLPTDSHPSNGYGRAVKAQEHNVTPPGCQMRFSNVQNFGDLNSESFKAFTGKAKDVPGVTPPGCQMRENWVKPFVDIHEVKDTTVHGMYAELEDELQDTCGTCRHWNGQEATSEGYYYYACLRPGRANTEITVRTAHDRKACSHWEGEPMVATDCGTCRHWEGLTPETRGRWRCQRPGRITRDVYLTERWLTCRHWEDGPKPTKKLTMSEYAAWTAEHDPIIKRYLANLQGLSCDCEAIRSLCPGCEAEHADITRGGLCDTCLEKRKSGMSAEEIIEEADVAKAKAEAATMPSNHDKVDADCSVPSWAKCAYVQAFCEGCGRMLSAGKIGFCDACGNHMDKYFHRLAMYYSRPMIDKRLAKRMKKSLAWNPLFERLWNLLGAQETHRNMSAMIKREQVHEIHNNMAAMIKREKAKNRPRKLKQMTMVEYAEWQAKHDPAVKAVIATLKDAVPWRPMTNEEMDEWIAEEHAKSGSLWPDFEEMMIHDNGGMSL